MPNVAIYQVMEEFDRKKDYGIAIYPFLISCITKLRKDQRITTTEFIKENEFSQNDSSDFTTSLFPFNHILEHLL